MTDGCVPVRELLLLLPRGGVVQISAKAKRLIQINKKVVVCLKKQTIAFIHITEVRMIKQVKRGEIYYADLSPVVGSEQSGIRPVLIIQNDRDNNSSPTTIVAAITSSKTKAELPTHVTFTAECLPYESTVLLEQIRTIDKTRFSECVGEIDNTTMENVDRAIAVSFGIGYIGEKK